MSSVHAKKPTRGWMEIWFRTSEDALKHVDQVDPAHYEMHGSRIPVHEFEYPVEVLKLVSADPGWGNFPRAPRRQDIVQLAFLSPNLKLMTCLVVHPRHDSRLIIGSGRRTYFRPSIALHLLPLPQSHPCKSHPEET